MHGGGVGGIKLRAVGGGECWSRDRAKMQQPLAASEESREVQSYLLRVR